MQLENQPARSHRPAAFRGSFCVCCDLNAALSQHIGRRKFLAVAAGAAAAGVASAGAMSRSATTTLPLEATIYVAAKIITMDAARPTAQAVAVEGGRILAVGSLDEVTRAVGSRRYKVDRTFADKIVTPGLIEQHLHPILSALSLNCEVIANDAWDLPNRRVEAATTPAAYRKRLADAVRADKGTDFFFSWGYHQYWHGEISRAALDEISRTRAIAVWHRSCHEFYLNTPALAALGVTEASTKDQGLASEQAAWARGHFFEKGLNLILAPLMKRFATPERMVAGLTQLRTYLHRAGVTALNEPGAQIGLEQLQLYKAVLGAPDAPFTTTLIVDGRTMFERHGAAGALDATAKTIASAAEGKVRFLPKQIKFFADGAIVSQKMQMKGGYTDGHRGEWMTEPENFKVAWKLFWDAGYQPHTHVNGDLGLDMVLDAMEASLHERPRADHRSVIVHFANSTEEQVERIARLGAVVSANPYYVPAFADAYGEWGLGRERADHMTRLGSCVRRRIPVSLHSDMPIGPARPLFNAWCAVNRVTVSGRVAGPDQRISVEQALRAITIDAAQSWRLDHEMGSVSAGNVANLAVLEEDPFAVEPLRIKDIRIWGTMFEGRVFAV